MLQLHNHHIRFWYLWCCGCPGRRGRQIHNYINIYHTIKCISIPVLNSNNSKYQAKHVFLSPLNIVMAFLTATKYT